MLIINNNWKNRSNTNFYNGFSDTELEAICDIKNYSNPKIPPLFWTTEIYGFGKCYRDWLNIPSFIPIPFYGDHGVDLSGILAPHEKENKSKFHLTWNKYRFDNNIKSKSKKLIYITNPWVKYRRKKNIIPKKNAIGTIIFYSHTNTGIEFANNSHDNYFEELNNLDSKFSPFVICLHMHDVRKGLHKKLRKYGFPIITVGNSLNPDFVDRFYDIVVNFKQATSNKIGSQLFYCTEIGIPYFLYGEPQTLINFSEKNIPLGKVESFDEISTYLTSLIRKNFSSFNSVITDEQIEITEKILGLDSEVKISKLKKLFFLEFLRLLPFYLFSILKKIIKKIYNDK